VSEQRPPDLGLWSGVTAGGFVVLGLLLILPLLGVFAASFVDEGALSLTHWREALGQPYYRDAIGHSVVVGLGGAAGAVLLGLPLAYMTHRYRVPGAGGLWCLAVLALLSPPFIGAYAWVMMLGAGGFVRAWVREAFGLELPPIYGPAGIILVFALQYYPFVYLLTRGGLSTIDPSLEEAAESLGASPWRRLRRVTLPLVLPSVSAGALIAFMMSVANFGTPVVLGEPAHYRVLPTLAFDAFEGNHVGRAATLSLLLIACSILALIGQRYLETRRRVATAHLRRARQTDLAGPRAALVTGACWGIVALSTLPLAVVVGTSFRRTRGPVFQPGFGLGSYQQVLAGAPRPLINSLLFSVVAVVGIAGGGALLGYVVARRRGAAPRLLDALLVLPYVVPGIVLGLGLITAYGGPPLALGGTALIVVLAYFVRRLPYAVRSSAAILRQLDPAVEEAAASLGAPPGGVFWRVTLPLMAPGVAAGAVLGWVTAVNELSASVVLTVSGTVTLPVRVYQHVLHDEYGPASALATILLVATGLSLFLIRRYAAEPLEG
jgi:iron(III) transport system permease protein